MDLKESASPSWRIIWELDDWEALLVDWVSPLGQSHQFDITRAEVESWGIAAMSCGEPMPIVRAAAQKCFWAFQKPILTKIAAHEGVDIPDGADLFDCLWHLIRGILGANEEHALEIVSKRLGGKVNDYGNETVLQDILQLDEAIRMLDRDEEKQVRKEQERARDAVKSNTDYVRKFQGRKRAVVAAKEVAAAKAAPSGKGRQRTKAKASASSAPRPVRIPPGDLQQVQLAQFCPPGGHIWKGRVAGSWQGHFPPYPRYGASWHLYGHRYAAVLALRYLWQSYLEYNCKVCPQGCPIEHIFEILPDEAAAGAVILDGAAASSSGA